MDKLIRSLLASIKQANKKKTSSYDTTAQVRRIEGNTAWVHIPGGVDETPVKLTVNAEPGDTVQLRVGGGTAWITGNATAPPTDDKVAKVANRTANAANVLAGLAKKIADQAGKTATNYLSWSAQYGLIVSEDATENPEEMEGGSTRVTYDGVEMYKGQKRVAKFGEESVVGDEDSAHVYIDPDTFNVTNDTGAQFFSVDMNGESERLTFDKKVTSVIGVSATASVTISDSPELDFIEDGINIVVTIASVGGSYADNAGWGAIKGTAKTEAYTSQSGITFTLTYDGEHTFTVSWNNTVQRTVLLRVRESLNMNTPSLTFGTRSDTKGSFSSTFGEGLSASHANQVVIGRYNEDSSYAAFIIGNGVSDPNILSNALTVDWEGNLECNNLPAMVECGIKTGATTPANSYLSFTVSFDKNFTSVPIVTATLQATSSSVDFNKVQISVYNITTTGFYVRVYNGTASQTSPNITWIAMQKEALVHS